MAKQGEIEFLSKLGSAGIAHAVGKPFTDPSCGRYLMQIGAIMHLLPAPPARLLDLGCGTGWTSRFFARSGYQVVGMDIALNKIEHAAAAAFDEGLDNLEFEIADYESPRWRDEFECAVFFDSLHHALDEEAALHTAWRALVPGGVCVASEPGVGHAETPASREAVRRFNVTERDMPPRRIIAAAKRVGFRQFRVFPHAGEVAAVTYRPPAGRLQAIAERSDWLRRLRSATWLVRLLMFRANCSGVVLLTK